ncbi:MAG: helix-turn-helix domain-containing protein [Desulfovibrio sp.]
MTNDAPDQNSSPSNFFMARLRAAREMRSLSQAELATKTGLPPSSIAHFEGGKRKPSFDNLRKLSEALAVTTDYLLGRTDDLEADVNADPLFRHAAKLTDDDRKLVAGFLDLLEAKRGGKKEG